ncbi:hypothetical protein BV898_16635 [Hypsibius exemplaris]|uniref:Uncharacterized protein n=1 Tax=Hypsibius exemplaris TaxID=2072580 RepID=A0A9X6RM13_HYPEX|nr:hypothetical protein BV898_16635 [Hypsibius exemplaris]
MLSRFGGIKAFLFLSACLYGPSIQTDAADGGYPVRNLGRGLYGDYYGDGGNNGWGGNSIDIALPPAPWPPSPSDFTLPVFPPPQPPPIPNFSVSVPNVNIIEPAWPPSPPMPVMGSIPFPPFPEAPSSGWGGQGGY